MTSTQSGKGISRNPKETFSVKSSSDFNYKALCLENYNATKSIIVATAQDRFSKEKVAGSYLATVSLANMILPFVGDNRNNIQAMFFKDRIIELLTELENSFGDIWTMDVQDRADYVKKCEQVVGSLIPLFSFIGLYVRTTAKAKFYYPDKDED